MNSATTPGSLFDVLRVGLDFWLALPRQIDVIVMEDGRRTEWFTVSEYSKCAVRKAIISVSNHE